MKSNKILYVNFPEKSSEKVLKIISDFYKKFGREYK